MIYLSAIRSIRSPGRRIAWSRFIFCKSLGTPSRSSYLRACPSPGHHGIRQIIEILFLKPQPESVVTESIASRLGRPKHDSMENLSIRSPSTIIVDSARPIDAIQRGSLSAVSILFSLPYLSSVTFFTLVLPAPCGNLHRHKRLSSQTSGLLNLRFPSRLHIRTP